MDKRTMLNLGFAVPGVFWATLLISGRFYPGYNSARNLVSELGALDAPTRWIFNPGMLICAVLSVVFVLGLVRAARQAELSTLPAWLLLVHGVSLAGAALFPLPLPMHGQAGMLAMLLPLSPLLALMLWRPAGNGRLKLTAVTSLVLIGLGFSVLFPDFLPELAGLKQRVAHLGWTVWFAGLGAVISRK
ncbi:MAG TPA: DUF998 domain-containing protein [Candidatus Aminicenantes bacterium]|nr:DUF998 domain-containing protein [Candidatus Aminicenantes bacterium]